MHFMLGLHSDCKRNFKLEYRIRKRTNKKNKFQEMIYSSLKIFFFFTSQQQTLSTLFSWHVRCSMQFELKFLWYSLCQDTKKIYILSATHYIFEMIISKCFVFRTLEKDLLLIATHFIEKDRTNRLIEGKPGMYKQVRYLSVIWIVLLQAYDKNWKEWA